MSATGRASTEWIFAQDAGPGETFESDSERQDANRSVASPRRAGLVRAHAPTTWNCCP